MMRTIHRFEVVAIWRYHSGPQYMQKTKLNQIVDRIFTLLNVFNLLQALSKIIVSANSSSDCLSELRQLQSELRKPSGCCLAEILVGFFYVLVSFPIFVQLHRRKHRLSIVRQVTALLVEAFARDVRCADALITGGELGFFRELFQFFGDDRAARQKHWESRAHVIVEDE